MQQIKDLIYRKYDIDKLEKDVYKSQFKNIGDFYDTNIDDSKKTIRLLRAE